jgi:hypothetical protein
MALCFCRFVFMARPRFETAACDRPVKLIGLSHQPGKDGFVDPRSQT